MQSKIISIKGDASFRKFYRVVDKNKSRIIVTAKKEKYKNLVAYLAINEFLKKNKILTPKLYKENYPKGEIIIEDFGNLSLRKVLSKKKNKLPVYKKIINLLLKIQRIKPKLKVKSIINKKHKIGKYSINCLHKESDLFFQWYLPFFFDKKKIKFIKNKSRKELTKLYRKLNFPNSHFVHRDYHAENLMKVGSKIGVIDSQDALIGNAAYDLASLIDDVRIKIPMKLKNKIFKFYLKKTFSNYKKNSKLFLEDFNILSVQRCLKIIGIFSRLHKRDKKNKYLKLIPYTWKILEMRMNSKIFEDLKKILISNLDKKIRNKVISR